MNVVNAASLMWERSDHSLEVVSYDLTDHQPIETFTIEEDGEPVEITITPE